MQGFKKTLVALLAVAMVLSLVGPVFAAPADVEGTKYEDAVVRLMALGVFEGDPDGKFNPDNAISRAEAAAVVVRALGLRKSAEQMAGVTKFADVNADPGLQWATGYINFAVSEGIVVGYPDGRFGGRDEVTYAQLAKMMLYAMKYGVTVEGGVWPNAVLAKADDLKLTEGMPVAANAPMPRGDVAKLVDNALDVPTMVQVSWGGTQMWQPSGDTLIKKLGYDEVEGQVFEVTAVNDSLRENQLRVDIAKVNKESASGTGKYDLIDAFKPGDYFGLDVKVWVNEDDKAVYIEPVTKEENVVYDRVDEEYKDKKVTLLVKDKGYEEHEDGAYVYINGKEGSFRNLPQNAFGKFVLKDNRVWFADVYELTGDGAKGAIVKGVDEENVRYIVNSDTEKKLRLGEADSYVLYKDGKEIALSDVEADDVLYWYKDGDDYVIFVASAKVEGKLEKARDTSVVIAGKKYDLSFDKTDGITTVSANEDDDVKLYAEANEMLKDLGGEEVVALLDLHGYVRHIRGDAVSTSTVRGVVLNWWKTGSGYVKVFTSKDETATYEFEKLSAYTSAMGGLDEGKLYAVKLTLNADGEVKKAEVQDTPFAISAINKNGYLEFDTNKRIYVADSTVFIDAATDKDDPEIVSWDSVKDSKDLGTVKVLVLDKGNEANADAKLVVFTAGFDEIKPTSEKYALVTDKWDYRGDTMVELVTAGGDKEDFEAAGDTDFAAKGNMVVYRVNAKGQAVILAGVKKVDRKQLQVTKIDGRWVDLSDNSKVRVASDAVVYDATSTSGKLVEGSFSDISIGDTIAVMKEWKDPNFVTNGQAKVVLITKFGDGEPVGGGGGEGEGTVTFINTDDNSITVDGVVYPLTLDTVLIENGAIVETGTGITGGVKKLAVNDQVKVEGKVVTIVKRAAAAKEETDKIAAKKVEEMFLALPEAAKVELKHKDDIQAAQKAWDNLTADQKALVPGAAQVHFDEANAVLTAILSQKVVAEDFGKTALGYNVGFGFEHAKASDVSKIEITIYKGTTKLATVTSGKVMENYPNATSLSAPIAVFQPFDYANDEGGNWVYSGWNGANSDIPTKAVITVTFKSGLVVEVENSTVTGL